jgi:hypothetical protein
MTDITEPDIRSLEAKLQHFADTLPDAERAVLDELLCGDFDADVDVEGFSHGGAMLQYSGIDFTSTFVFHRPQWRIRSSDVVNPGVYRAINPQPLPP